jgi:ribosomal-protein-alanine N-acetyltransferase
MVRPFNFSPFPQLLTERLILRKPDISDIFELVKLRSHEDVNKFIDRPSTINVTDVHQFLSKIDKGIKENELLYWAIVPKEEFILAGTICLFNYSETNEKAEIGYELHPDFHSRGFMQEAIVKVIDFGFKEMNLKFMEAYTHPENFASQKILEKNGFMPYNSSENKNKDIIYQLFRQP